MINNVTLVGRLTKNPELRYTGSGIAVNSFTIAVDRPFTNAQGERDTDFINCVAWRGLAETINNLAVKGSLVGVTGRIQTRNYENNEGRRVYVTEISVDNFQILEPKSVTDQRRQTTGAPEQPSYNNNQGYSQGQYSQPNQKNDNNPFADANFSDNPFESSEDLTDISDDDLPF